MTVVLVCGGRDFATPKDKSKVQWERELQYFNSRMKMLWDQKKPDLLVHGNAEGPDKLSGEYALKQECNVMAVPAKWNTHGRSAGHKRNSKMLELQQVDLVIAFPGGRGTTSMIEKATQKRVRVVDLKEDYEEWLKKST